MLQQKDRARYPRASKWPSDSTVHGFHGHMRPHGPQTSTTTLSASGPGIQTWLSAAAWAQNTSWLLMDAQATQIRMALVVLRLLNTIKATCCTMTTGFCATFGGSSDPDMILSCTSDLDVTMPQATQICMTLAVACPLADNMDSSG